MTARQIGLVHELAPSLDDGLARVSKLATSLATRSPTAVAAYKQGLLAALGRPEKERLDIERAAYELCVDVGEAAIGRAAFSARRADGPKPDSKAVDATSVAPVTPAWGARRLEPPR